MTSRTIAEAETLAAAGLVLPPVLSECDVAAALRVSRATVRKLRRGQGLPMARVGRGWVIAKVRLLEWLDDRAAEDGGRS